MTNKISIDAQNKKRVHLDIIGDNNTIIVKDFSESSLGNLFISLNGNNCSIVIDANVYIGEKLNICVGQIHPNFGMVENVHIYIGKATSFESTSIMTYNSNSSVEIGDKCMFSFGITLYNTDGHPIFDASSGNIINPVKKMQIGNRVWVGANVAILKNTVIKDDCIIGMGSIVNSRYATIPIAKSIIAGNPAKVVKSNVCWDSNGSLGYVQNVNETSLITQQALSVIHETTSFTDMYVNEISKNKKNLIEKICYKVWKHLDKKFG